MTSYYRNDENVKMMINRIDCTESAKEMIAILKAQHGDLMFYQAGGCCEGTQPQCFEKGRYYLRMNDVCLGEIEDTEFWVDRDLYEYWKYSHFTLDILDGFGVGGFSLETPHQKTFKIHYRLFTPEELEELAPVKLAE